jgi:hypothetical protein
MSIDIDRSSRIWTIKVVPDNEPVSTAYWIKTTLAQHAIKDHTMFGASCYILKAWCPKGHSIISIALDLPDRVKNAQVF